ncbi:MAG: DUF4193 family protein [Actinomycetota bacterium]|jgi:hypothetical protein
MEDIEDRVDEETDESSDDDAEEDSPREEPPARPATTDGQGGDVESIEELIVKKEERAAQEEDEDDSVLSLTREERLEPLAVKVVPPQPTEFVCKNCYLVKHRSQLKDKTRMLCRDCA